MYTQIEIETHFEGKLKIAYLNQPETYNSLNKVLLQELKNFIVACNEDENVRCVALSGRGKAFCSGQNLKEALSLGNVEEERVIQKMVVDYYNPLVEEIAHCRKPVVSLVNGPAVGAVFNKGGYYFLINNERVAFNRFAADSRFIRLGADAAPI